MQNDPQNPDAPADEPETADALVATDAEAPVPPEADAEEAVEMDAGEGASSGEPEGTTDPASADAPQGGTRKGVEKKTKKEKEKETPTWTPPPPERLEGAIEAILLVAGDVVKVERLRDLLGLQSVLPLREAIAAIQTRWAEAGHAMELEEVGGGVRAVTRPEYAEYVGRMVRKPLTDKLSKTQLETLSIVAYKQPVGRAEVERIRGVQAGEPLRALLERRLIKVVGRSDQPGRPLLYGTTQLFLTAFGLNTIKDLPSAKDLKRL